MRYQTAPLPDDPHLGLIIEFANPPDQQLAMMVGPAGFEPTT